MASSDKTVDDSLYPIAVLIDELKNEDVQVSFIKSINKVYMYNCAINICTIYIKIYIYVRIYVYFFLEKLHVCIPMR